MANKKKTGARFTLPSEEDLDKSLEKIRSGSTFLSRIRAAKNDEKNLGQQSLVDVGLATSDSDKSGKKQQAPKGKNEEPKDVSACKLSRLETKEELKARNIIIDNDNENVKRNAEFAEEKAKTATDDIPLATKSLLDDSKNELPSGGKNPEEGSNLPNQAKVDVPVLAAVKMSTNSIIVNGRQRGNPILKHIRNVPWEYGEIIPDYVLGQTTCALFLSLRYHNFNPEYIHDRLKQLGHRFELRILLVQVDVKDPHASLKELSKMCILADCTLILAWSTEEAGRYLETYKSYENKPADVLQERVDGDYQSKMIDCLTSVKSVNKTDAVTLMSNFGSLKNILQASKDEISLCPGFGPQKAERLVKLCHEPFIKKNRSQKEGTNNQIDSTPSKQKKQTT